MHVQVAFSSVTRLLFQWAPPFPRHWASEVTSPWRWLGLHLWVSQYPTTFLLYVGTSWLLRSRISSEEGTQMGRMLLSLNHISVWGKGTPLCSWGCQRSAIRTQCSTAIEIRLESSDLGQAYPLSHLILKDFTQVPTLPLSCFLWSSSSSQIIPLSTSIHFNRAHPHMPPHTHTHGETGTEKDIEKKSDRKETVCCFCSLSKMLSADKLIQVGS